MLDHERGLLVEDVIHRRNERFPFVLELAEALLDSRRCGERPWLARLCDPDGERVPISLLSNTEPFLQAGVLRGRVAVPLLEPRVSLVELVDLRPAVTERIPARGPAT